MAHVNFTLKLLAVTYSMSLSNYGTLIKLKAHFPNEIDNKIQCSCQKPLFISVNLVCLFFINIVECMLLNDILSIYPL